MSLASTDSAEIEWKPVTTLSIIDTEVIYLVSGLDKTNEVNFRVLAVNEVGASEASTDSG